MKIPTEIQIKIFNEIIDEVDAYNYWVAIFNNNEDSNQVENDFLEFMNKRRWENTNGYVYIPPAPTHPNIEDRHTHYNYNYDLVPAENLVIDTIQAFLHVKRKFNKLEMQMKYLNNWAVQDSRNTPIIWRIETKKRLQKTLEYLDELNILLSFKQSRMERFINTREGTIVPKDFKEYADHLNDVHDCWWCLE
jgi:hypothetical protein